MDSGPAEMNSLYGSMTRSAVISLLNSRCAMILDPTRTAPVWPPIPRIAARRICLVSGSDPEFRRREATRAGDGVREGCDHRDEQEEKRSEGGTGGGRRPAPTILSRIRQGVPSAPSNHSPRWTNLQNGSLPCNRQSERSDKQTPPRASARVLV